MSSLNQAKRWETDLKVICGVWQMMWRSSIKSVWLVSATLPQAVMSAMFVRQLNQIQLRRPLFRNSESSYFFCLIETNQFNSRLPHFNVGADIVLLNKSSIKSSSTPVSSFAISACPFQRKPPLAIPSLLQTARRDGRSGAGSDPF